MRITRMLSLQSNNDETVSIKLCLCAAMDTSQIEPETSKPKLFQSTKALSSSFSLREQVCTLAPSPPNSSTMARLTKQKNKNQSKKKKSSKFTTLRYMATTRTSFFMFIKMGNFLFLPDSTCAASYQGCHALEWPSVRFYVTQRHGSNLIQNWTSVLK